MALGTRGRCRGAAAASACGANRLFRAGDTEMDWSRGMHLLEHQVPWCRRDGVRSWRCRSWRQLTQLPRGVAPPQPSTSGLSRLILAISRGRGRGFARMPLRSQGRRDKTQRSGGSADFDRRRRRDPPPARVSIVHIHLCRHHKDTPAACHIHRPPRDRGDAGSRAFAGRTAAGSALGLAAGNMLRVRSGAAICAGPSVGAGRNRRGARLQQQRRSWACRRAAGRPWRCRPVWPRA